VSTLATDLRAGVLQSVAAQTLPGPQLVEWLDAEIGEVRGEYEGEIRTLESLVTRLREELVQCRERAEQAERELGWVRVRSEAAAAQSEEALAAARRRPGSKAKGGVKKRSQSASRPASASTASTAQSSALLTAGRPTTSMGTAKRRVAIATPATARAQSASRGRAGSRLADFDSFVGRNGEWTPESTTMMRSALAASAAASATASARRFLPADESRSSYPQSRQAASGGRAHDPFRSSMVSSVRGAYGSGSYGASTGAFGTSTGTYLMDDLEGDPRPFAVRKVPPRHSIGR
jgi:hypothetical protein